jgi:DUF4097 and DUF4098 domain-containing protein YvlB
MPEFDTPEPISADIELTAGEVTIVAEDRDRTVVDVTPCDPSDDADVQAAEQTQVEYTHGRLTVRAPKTRIRWFFGQGGSIGVTVRLPAGSDADVRAVSARLRCEGRLDQARFESVTGDVWLERAGALRLKSSSGEVWLGRADGQVMITSSDGGIRIGEIGGSATVKTSNGDLSVGEITGDLHLKTAAGDITVDRALAGVSARTAYGSIRVGEVVRGVIDIATATGDLEVGVRQGSSAWLDARSEYGDVRSTLNAADGPGDAKETVEVRAHTSYGDILVRRA